MVPKQLHILLQQAKLAWWVKGMQDPLLGKEAYKSHEQMNERMVPDLCKSFGTAPYDILRCKMEKWWVDRIAVRWIYNLLNKHKQSIPRNELKSEWQDDSRAVSYRSVMGPVLISIFINDLTIRTESWLIKFQINQNWECLQTLEDGVRI